MVVASHAPCQPKNPCLVGQRPCWPDPVRGIIACLIVAARRMAAAPHVVYWQSAWRAVGCAMDTYAHVLAYSRQHQQFGKPIANVQRVQNLLMGMLGNATASQYMVLRLSQMRDAGIMDDEHASLAKAFCTSTCRETIGFARKLLGGNGILWVKQVGHFVADAEAIYSCEGTREGTRAINTLIAGRAITGFGTFV